MTVQQDKGCGTLGGNPKFAQIAEVAQCAFTACTEDTSCTHRPDTGNAQQHLTVGGVELDGGVDKVLISPRHLGVLVQRQIAVLGEGKFLYIEAVVAQ